MNVQELLQCLREDILHDESDQPVGSVTSDYLWSDNTLIRYINEAQTKFAMLTQCLRDGTTPDVTSVPLIPGQREYQLHWSIISVISCKRQGDRVDLAKAGHAAFSTYHMPDAYFFDPGSLDELPPGKVVAYDTDEYVLPNDEGSWQTMNLRVYPKPAVPYITPLRLRVIRMPIYKLTLSNLDAVPEIPSVFHMDMLDYSAYLALRKVDRDAEDIARADKFLQAFLGHVEEAKDLAKRKMFTPLQWGFGRNGFSWNNQ
jgi:hypothetical protein